MHVGIVGSGPAAESVRAALSEADASATAVSADALGDCALGVGIDAAGDPVFERANRVTRESGTPLITVEIGGIGGLAIDDVDAAVSGFTPETGCYECLGLRVAADDVETADRPRAARGTERLAGAIAGRELVAALAGEETAVLGGVIELPYVERRVLAVPNCDVCGASPDPPDARSRVERSLEDAIARAEPAMDDRVGVVRSVGEVASFPAPYYLATGGETSGFSDASAPSQAAGVAADWNAAYMKALGEALERYSAGVYRTGDFERGRADEMENAVPPEAFVRTTDDGGDAIPWTDGESLVDGDPATLPAEVVHFPPPDHRFGPSITTGLGLGNSPVEALLSGLYEVVERDATMLAWYSTFEPLELVVEDGTFGALVKRARSEGLAVTPLLVTQDIDVPVVAVAVHPEEDDARSASTGTDPTRDDRPRFAVGSGADLDPDAAARSALCEALQNWMELRSMGSDGAADESGWIGRYAGFPEAARSFVDADGQVPSERVGPADPPDGVDELDALVGRVTEAGLQPYAAWLTPRDVRALGFEAARVVVPGAQPLFTREAVFGERAETVPESMGFEPRPDREPHPYP